MKKFIMIIIAGLALALNGCSNDTDIKTTESGLKYIDESVGEGRNAKDGDLISLHFRGWIVKDSTDLFSDWTKDSTRMQYLIGDSYIRQQQVKFVLGQDAFIRGIDDGIIGMVPNSKRIIVIPSNLAYGEQGMGPIPPDTDLKVLIELLEVKDPVIAEMWDVEKSEIKSTETGLMYAIVQEGEGEYAQVGNVVTVHYSGFLEGGTKFDSSVERDEPFSFVVGNKQVIPGWDEGVRLMKKGGKARLVIPPSLGYGDILVGKIPPSSTLVFDVELLEIK
jgi:peptidylprolyl isomerase